MGCVPSLLCQMGAGCRWAGGLVHRVGDHGSVHDVREPALECSDRFLAGVAVGLASFDERDGVGVIAGLGERDPMERCVQLAVPSPAESVSFSVA